MPIIGTFNGFNLYQMPASPAPRSIVFTAQNVVSVSASPFTGQQQVQDWQSGWLEGAVTLPPMKQVLANAWIAWMLQMRGQVGLLQLGDVLGALPRGSGLGSPVVAGGGQFGFQLVTRGWPASASVPPLLPGDWLQVGPRLYRNLEPVHPDGSGNATLSVWPNLRESPADGVPLVLQNTTGLFRLSDPAVKWSVTEARIYGISFDIREAI